MRRILGALVAAGLLLASTAAPVTAAPPQHATGVMTLDLTERFCPSFDVHWVETSPNQQMLGFAPSANGDSLIRFAGPMQSQLTNPKSGTSISVGGGVRVDLIVHPNGTIDLWASGAVVVGYRGGLDAGGPSLSLVDGRVHDLIAPDGVTTLTHEIVSGRVVDLCAFLA